MSPGLHAGDNLATTTARNLANVIWVRSGSLMLCQFQILLSLP